MTTRTFDPNKGTVAYKGIPLSGFGEGSYLTITQEANDFEDMAGGDGEVARVAQTDKRATVTLVLLQTSESNDVLDEERRLDVATGGQNPGSFYYRDGSGRTVVSASEAWIQKPADVTIGNGVEARSWPIRLANAEIEIGGN